MLDSVRNLARVAQRKADSMLYKLCLEYIQGGESYEPKLLARGNSVNVNTSEFGKKYVVKFFKENAGATRSYSGVLKSMHDKGLLQDDHEACVVTKKEILARRAAGDLFEFISQRKLVKFSIEDKFRIAMLVVKEVERFHAMGRAHRDIKVENILCWTTSRYDKPRSLEELYLTLSDFEFSQDSDGPQFIARNNTPGTLDKLAPEIFLLKQEGQEVDLKKADIWSLGVTIFTILTGKEFLNCLDWHICNEKCNRYEVISRFFQQDSKHINARVKRTLGESIYHEGIANFLSKLLVVEPDQRLTASEALSEMKKIVGEMSEIDQARFFPSAKWYESGTLRHEIKQLEAYQALVALREKLNRLPFEEDTQEFMAQVYQIEHVFERLRSCAPWLLENRFKCERVFQAIARLIEESKKYLSSEAPASSSGMTI